MPLATIRAEIKAVLQAVDTVGKVHDYERWTNDPATLLTLFKPASTDTHLRSWFFKLASRNEFTRSNRRTVIVYTFDVVALYSLKDADATEKTFTDLLMTMCDEFRKLTRKTLNGSCETTDTEEGPLAGRTGLQVGKIEMIKLGGVLVHFARMQLGAQEIVAR